MLKVLIAEDQMMIAELLEGVLTESGYEVCGIARDVTPISHPAITRVRG